MRQRTSSLPTPTSQMRESAEAGRMVFDRQNKTELEDGTNAEAFSAGRPGHESPQTPAALRPETPHKAYECFARGNGWAFAGGFGRGRYAARHRQFEVDAQNY